MPLKSKHSTRAYPFLQPGWLLISEQKTRRLSSHAIWGDRPAGRSPPRALFHSVDSLSVACGTQYVINTLSFCSSVTILIAAHPGSLGHLLCLNIGTAEALFFFTSKSVKTGAATQTMLAFCYVLFLFTQAFYLTLAIMIQERFYCTVAFSNHKIPFLTYNPQYWPLKTGSNEGNLSRLQDLIKGSSISGLMILKHLALQKHVARAAILLYWLPECGFGA